MPYHRDKWKEKYIIICGLMNEVKKETDRNDTSHIYDIKVKYMTGIYKITNLINGNSYVGQSVDIQKRWKREKEDASNINSHSYEYPLMRALRKYGFDNFIFEVIEECKIEELNEKEVYWIDYYDTFFHGYNQTLGGDATSRQPKEKIIGIISDLINTNMLHKDIAEKWDISTEMVQGINTGRCWKHDADYPLQKRQASKIYCCEECGKEISRGSKLCIDCYNILREIGVVQIDKDTNEQISCFKSIVDATRSLGLSNNCGSHISAVCQGKRKTAYGYKWKYLDDNKIQ